MVDEMKRKRERHSSRKVYLAKDPLDIHIDSSLPQHQIEGVRFLYRMYSKGKPGVILNDPSGYGKRVQTVVFLDAMRPLLRRPVLVLCKEGRELKWEHLFHRWSRTDTEVSVVRSSPPVLKSSVYINPMTNLWTFTCREWSVVVVDESTVSRDMFILRTPMMCHFRIWITSMDMKKYIHTFSIIHKWLYQIEESCVEDFQVIKKTPSVVHKKSILLDAFMEDVVIRRNGDISPFLTTTPPKEIVQNPQNVTRKNKDVTGKKIKRSKRDSQEPDATDSPTITTMDIIEGFINDLQTISDNNKEVDGTGKKNEENNKNADNMNESKNPVQDIQKDDEMKFIEYSSEVNNTPESIDLNDDDPSSQEIQMKYDSDTPDNSIDIDKSDEKIYDGDEKIDDIEEKNEVRGKKPNDCNEKVDYIDEKNDDGGVDIESVDKNTDDHDIKVDDGDKKIDIEEKFKHDDTPEPDEIIKIEDTKDKEKLESVDLFTNTDDKGGKSNENLAENDLGEVKSDNNELVVNSDKKTEQMSSLEMRMKQLEELTKKKFKGSLLDTIF